jgi:hypothetical protein
MRSADIRNETRTHDGTRTTRVSECLRDRAGVRTSLSSTLHGGCSGPAPLSSVASGVRFASSRVSDPHTLGARSTVVECGSAVALLVGRRSRTVASSQWYAATQRTHGTHHARTVGRLHHTPTILRRASHWTSGSCSRVSSRNKRGKKILK